MAAAFEVVTTRDGVHAVRDLRNGELMHPVGPVREAREVYVDPSGLERRLGEGPVTVFDVGLGGGSNALEAWRRSEARQEGPKLTIYSFDRTSDALALATSSAHAGAFGFSEQAAQAAQGVLRTGRHETDLTEWNVVLGELPATLSRPGVLADIVYWDMYSAQSDPELWTYETFCRLRATCGPRATLHTYAAATSFRSALILAGFCVGFGPATGTKSQTTQAAVHLQDLAEPLDARWYLRLQRSSAPLPPDAPDGALDTIAAYFEEAGLDGLTHPA